MQTSAGSDGGRPPQRADLERLTTPQLVARLAQDAQTVIKAEIDLGKSELRVGVAGALAALRRLAVGVVLGLLGAGALVAGCVLALAQALPAWAAALVIGALLAVASAIALLAGRSRRT